MFNGISIPLNLANYWETGTYETRQFIQNFAFPDGLHWDRNTDNYRTVTENEVLWLIRLFSESCKSAGAQKKRKIVKFSSLVDYPFKISNLFKALKVLEEWFAKNSQAILAE